MEISQGIARTAAPYISGMGDKGPGPGVLAVFPPLNTGSGRAAGLRRLTSVFKTSRELHAGNIGFFLELIGREKVNIDTVFIRQGFGLLEIFYAELFMP